MLRIYRLNQFFSKRTKNRARRINVSKNGNRRTACFFTSTFRRFDRERNETAKCIRVYPLPENKSNMRDLGEGRRGGVEEETAAVCTSCGARRNFFPVQFDKTSPAFHLFSYLSGADVNFGGERVSRYYERRRGLSTPWLVRSPGGVCVVV